MSDDKVHSALETGKVRILYLMGDNPLDPEKKVDGIEDALKKCELIIVQDIALNEAAKIADVVLPADSFAEADGTFTNMEGRVQRIRKAVQGPGGALADAKIISLLLSRLGEDTGYRSAKDVFNAICGEVPGYGDMSFEALETEGSMLIK
jgi:predicted molibdopterin-dependent oxidoreductase YjgC